MSTTGSAGATSASARAVRGTLGVAAASLALAAGLEPGSTQALAEGSAAILIAIACILLANVRCPGRGFDVAIESVLGAGVVVFVAWVLELGVLFDGADDAPQIAALSCAVIATIAAASVSCAFPARRAPVLVACGSAVLLVARLVSTIDPDGWVAADRARTVLLVAAAGLVAAAVGRPGPLLVATTSRRPLALTVPRLAIVVVAVAASPLALASLAAESTDAASAAAPLAVLGALGVVYLTRMLEQRSPLEHLALHDELTGLPNRVLFVERLDLALAEQSAWSASAPADAAASTAVLFVDVDRFKKVNDSLGHSAGDQLLREVASRLGGQLREGDLVARLGGDEFAVLVEDAGRDVAAEVAQRMLDALREPITLQSHEVFVAASIGIAVAPDDGDDSTALLRNADAAMYSAKDGGRGRWEAYRPEMNDTAEQRLDLEAALHRALESNEGLAVYYQPKVEIGTGVIVGAEALVRWNHPTRGLLLPTEFIPLAEDTGLIVALGEWVLEQTCADLARWREAGLAPIVGSVNLSARQFQHHSVADIVAGALRSTGLDPSQLELELTESLVLQDSDQVVSALHDLRSLGVSCSVDDFGTGYSGLNYLTRFPIDRLKIDRSFIAQIAAGGRDARLVAAVIAMARSLELGVVAEGVETDEQAAFLLAHGCNQMQGYLFSRPIPAHEFELLLIEQAQATTDERPIVPVASVHFLRPAEAG